MRETSGGGGRKQGAIAPCAACKLLRRRCAQDCVFAPYFPADEPHKFASVHKVFGASNVNKMLQELPEHQRSDAVSSMVYEANARVRDPVYGCVGAISSLQQQIDDLQSQLAMAQAEVVHMRLHQYPSTPNPATNYNNIFSENKHNIICSNSTSHSPQQTKSFFTMDFVVDNNNNNININNNHYHHPNIGESLWSC